MSQTRSTIYIAHPNVITQEQLNSLFYALLFPSRDAATDSMKNLVYQTAAIISRRGETLTRALMDKHELQAIQASKINHQQHYLTAEYLHTKQGDIVMEDLLSYVTSLCPEIDARAYLYDSEYQLEIFMRVEQQQHIVRRYYEPYALPRHNVDPLSNGIYAWWHENLPDTVKLGKLNEIPAPQPRTYATSDAPGTTAIHNTAADSMNEGQHENSQQLKESIFQLSQLLQRLSKPSSPAPTLSDNHPIYADKITAEVVKALLEAKCQAAGKLDSNGILLHLADNIAIKSRHLIDGKLQKDSYNIESYAQAINQALSTLDCYTEDIVNLNIQLLGDREANAEYISKISMEFMGNTRTMEVRDHVTIRLIRNQAKISEWRSEQTSGDAFYS